MINRILLMSSATILAGLLRTASADELEQGIQYSCSNTELKLQSTMKDGGGEKNPFDEMDTPNAGLWNIDRLKRKLPIVKICLLGKHKLTAVIFQQCVGGGGVAPSAAVYADTEVTIDKSGAIISTGAHPIVEAKIFGTSCWQSTAAHFTEISVRVSGLGEKDLLANEPTLIVQMR
jgi:hypothetical protein